jgi:5-bromo-4-chloroindolyl phosphate hydrolysis protein
MMAKRFCADFSPNRSQKTKKTKVSAEVKIKAKVYDAGARSNVLFTPAIVVAATSIGKGAIALSLGLASAAALTLGAWLMRDGLRAHAAFDARRVARRPAIPRKLFSALALGIGVALAAFRNDGQILASVIYGACTTVLTIAAFGLDPMHDKGMEGIDIHQQDRVARAVDAAEAHLTAMQDAIKRVRVRAIETRLEQFAITARDLFRTVEEDPRDLTSARKYLSVYLQGARDATIAFADLYGRTGDDQAKADYLALLDDLEGNFAARTQKLLADDRTDLTIEIDVLRDRLAREKQINT